MAGLFVVMVIQNPSMWLIAHRLATVRNADLSHLSPCPADDCTTIGERRLSVFFRAPSVMARSSFERPLGA